MVDWEISTKQGRNRDVEIPEILSRIFSTDKPLQSKAPAKVSSSSTTCCSVKLYHYNSRLAML